MSTREGRPVITDEEFDEYATVRLLDFNAPKGMCHELKDKFEALKMEKTMGAISFTRDDASDQMTSLQCFNSMDMIEPDQHEREPRTFHKWNQLFVSGMMFISATLHVQDVAFFLKKRHLLQPG